MLKKPISRFSFIFPAACCLFLFSLTPLALHAGGGDTHLSPPLPETDMKNVKTLSTSVFYRERMMLPPGSTLTVTLEDVSKMDVKADIITYETLTDIKAPPYHIDLKYNPEQIEERMRYGVRARIENGGQLLFTNTEHIDPFAGKPGVPVEVLVQRISRKQKNVTADASLTNTYWKLTKLAGRDAELGEGEKELSMVLTTDENRVRGYAGCNNFNGSYETGGNNLRFGMVAATMRMCSKGMEQEQMFFSILDRTAQYVVNGENLSLMDEAGQTIAEFESRSMQ